MRKLFALVIAALAVSCQVAGAQTPDSMLTPYPTVMPELALAPGFSAIMASDAPCNIWSGTTPIAVRISSRGWKP